METTINAISVTERMIKCDEITFVCPKTAKEATGDYLQRDPETMNVLVECPSCEEPHAIDLSNALMKTLQIFDRQGNPESEEEGTANFLVGQDQ